MLNKKLRQLSLLALLLCSTTTYAATNASMWGRSTSTSSSTPSNSIDQPIPPIEQVEQQQAQIRAEQEALANQKNICEILSGQPSLSSDTANASKIRDALSQAYKQALPEYKSLLISSEAANTLYGKWRDLYMKTYCTK